MPTLPKVKRALLEALPEQMEGDVIELGSGWGTLTKPLAVKYPKCRVVGYEISPVPYLYSKLFCRKDNLEVFRRNFFSVDFTDVKLAVCYLYPGAMEKLKSKFECELARGAIVVSHTFAVPGWTAVKTITVSDMYRTKIYVYER